jgi:hypothetical protein
MLLWLFCEGALAVWLEKRVSPLRCAPVEMTISFLALNFEEQNKQRQKQMQKQMRGFFPTRLAQGQNDMDL